MKIYEEGRPQLIPNQGPSHTSDDNRSQHIIAPNTLEN